MKNDLGLIFKSEILWWGVTAIILTAVLAPLYFSKVYYPFWGSNVVFVLVFITFTRYIFLLRHTPLRFAQWAKATIFLLCIPLVVYLIRQLHTFQLFTDETGLQSLFESLPDREQSRLVEYTKTEMTFFGVGGILVSIIMPFRMLISFWRTYNHGTT